MKAITYTSARKNLARTIDQVIDDHDPIIITKKNDRAVVVMSLEDYESMEETAYLLQSPINAKRLIDSIDQLKAVKTVEKDIQSFSE